MKSKQNSKMNEPKSVNSLLFLVSFNFTAWTFTKSPQKYNQSVWLEKNLNRNNNSEQI